MRRRTSTLFAVAVLFSVHGTAASRTSQDRPRPEDEPRWHVSGRVVEAGTGRPLGGIVASVLLPKIPYAWMVPGGDRFTTDAEGRFRGAVFFPATFVLYAGEIEMPNTPEPGSKGTRPHLGQLFRPLAVGGPPGGTTEWTVSLGPAATARVTVTDEQGRVVSEASVIAVSQDAPHPVQFLDCAVTDAKGTVEYVGLGEGSWRLLVCKRGIGVATTEVPSLKWAEKRAEKREVAVRLGPSGDLYLACRARLAEGEGDLDVWAVMCEVLGADGALVSLGPLSGRQWGFKNADEVPRSKEGEGFVFAGSYAPGRYRVLVRSPRRNPETTAEFARDCVEASEAFVIEAGKETRVRVALDLPGPR